MAKVLDVRVPGEVHVGRIPGGAEIGVAVDGRMVAWRPLGADAALIAADALNGARPAFEDSGFLVVRRGDEGFLSFLGLTVQMGGKGASRVASALRTAVSGENAYSVRSRGGGEHER
jgi:hypothetical protein